LWYRWDDSFIVLAGVQIEGFRFGYSYDLTTSELTNETGGSHEISVSFLFPCKPPRRRFKTLNCPKF
ncbi:MAG: type IX secretion system membrane protein PorP/SprF, partial [Bacteroidota bacterium]